MMQKEMYQVKDLTDDYVYKTDEFTPPLTARFRASITPFKNQVLFLIGGRDATEWITLDTVEYYNY